jgi:hypothetical protein
VAPTWEILELAAAELAGVALERARTPTMSTTTERKAVLIRGDMGGISWID